MNEGEKQDYDDKYGQNMSVELDNMLSDKGEACYLVGDPACIPCQALDSNKPNCRLVSKLPGNYSGHGAYALPPNAIVVQVSSTVPNI
jgi:hypothetical protein